MSKVEVIILFVVLLVVGLAGVFPSLLRDDWSWFERSGSILAAFGVLIAYLDFSGKLEKNIVSIVADSEVLARASRIKIQRDNSPDKEGGLALLDYRIQNIEKNLTKLHSTIKKRLMFIEFSLVFIGTIVWGYGSKLPSLWG